MSVATASLITLGLLLRRCHSAVLAAQLAFACSWLLVMLHCQGSLSNLMTLGLRLGGLGYILWAILYAKRVGPLLLAGILGGGWLVLYYESINFFFYRFIINFRIIKNGI